MRSMPAAPKSSSTTGHFLCRPDQVSQVLDAIRNIGPQQDFGYEEIKQRSSVLQWPKIDVEPATCRNTTITTNDGVAVGNVPIHQARCEIGEGVAWDDRASGTDTFARPETVAARKIARGYPHTVTNDDQNLPHFVRLTEPSKLALRDPTAGEETVVSVMLAASEVAGP